MENYNATVNALAKGYVEVHHLDAATFVRDDINCAIGLREWDKALVLYNIQTRIQQIAQAVAADTDT